MVTHQNVKGIKVCDCDGMQTFKKYLVLGSHCERAIKVQGKGQRVGGINVPDKCVCLCFPVISNSWPCFTGFSQERKALSSRVAIHKSYIERAGPASRVLSLQTSFLLSAS